jgi:hypothetical protein
MSSFDPSLKRNSLRTEGETVSDRTANLKPWLKGVSGNPGGRPKKKAITEELERLLEEEAPNGDGKTWAAAIAEALLKQAAKGDVRAITELANRVEGKPVQAVAAEVGGLEGLAEAIAEGRKRVARLTDQGS